MERSNADMTRRSALQMIPAGLASAQAGRAAAPSAGRLKQSLARWCYAKIPLDDLCRQAAEMGVSGIDLVEPADWPTIRKYGLVPTLTQGDSRIPDGWNRKESHDRLEREIRARIVRAAEAKVPNVITFSGNRQGMSDEEGRDNCVPGLKRIAEVCGRQGRHGLHGTAQQQSEPQRLPVRPHGMGRGGGASASIRRASNCCTTFTTCRSWKATSSAPSATTIQYIAHFHTGGVPGRHELDDTQELNGAPSPKRSRT